MSRQILYFQLNSRDFFLHFQLKILFLIEMHLLTRKYINIKTHNPYIRHIYIYIYIYIYIIVFWRLRTFNVKYYKQKLKFMWCNKSVVFSILTIFFFEKSLKLQYFCDRNNLLCIHCTNDELQKHKSNKHNLIATIIIKKPNNLN